MVGILCNQVKENLFTKAFNDFIKRTMKTYEESVLVFSSSNINLVNGTVFGKLITGRKIKTLKTEIPKLIFNLSKQRSRSDVKKIRALMEIEGISIINTVNRYSQLTIMDMLSSNCKTKKYIMEYSGYKKGNLQRSFERTGNIILKPDKGSNISKVLYSAKNEERFEFQDKVQSIVKSNKWISLNTSELKTNRNTLSIKRIHLQKLYNNQWVCLSKSVFHQSDLAFMGVDRRLEIAATRIINCISNYIPEIGICHIDFVIDSKNKIYFLNFGGWDGKFLAKKTNSSIMVKIIENIMDMAIAHRNMQKGGNGDVD